MVRNYQVFKLILACIIAVVLVGGWTYLNVKHLYNPRTVDISLKVQSTSENGLEPCTFRAISDHLRTHEKFMTSGKWIGHNNSDISSTTRGYYDPEFCLLKRKEDNSPWLSSCLRETNTKNILLLGDSNSRRAASAFLATLEKREGFNCEETLNRSKRSKTGYFELMKENSCKWIFELNFLCEKNMGYDLSSSLTVNVQYVQMYWLKHHVSSVDRSNTTSFCPDVANKSVNTFQEYILGEFAGKTKPDLIILPATAHTRYMSVKQWTEEQKWSMEKADALLPTFTTVVLMSQMAWRENKLPCDKPEHVNRVNDSGDILTINQQVQRQNNIFHQLLYKRLHNDHTRVNILPFFDLYNMSCQVQNLWYGEDFIHCRPYFYNGVHDALFETFCNSFTAQTHDKLV